MNRVALVIGNSEYLNIGKLNNPKNDANDIASILGKLNFDVEKVIDADLLDIQRSVNKFLQALDEYAVGLFFYAGHGMQIDGKNYIVPVDLKLGDKSRTTVSCYCLNGEINCGKIKFSVSSNIPDGTPLLFTLRGKGYCAQCKSVVDNGVLVSEWFSDHGDAIKNGCYTVELSSPIYSILPERIQRIFGERNRNIYGSCVKFNPIGGNTIHCSFGLIIKEKSIHVIDFQEKISAL